MLNLDRNNLPLLSEELLKKQRTTLLIIAFLLLAGGILCLVNPFASGAALKHRGRHPAAVERRRADYRHDR